jgi:beta-N-acetylhexosaminidase
MGVHLRRRAVLVVVLLAALAAAIPLLTGGDEDAAPVTEAGSSFRAAPQVRERGSSLISALAPLLGAGSARGTAAAGAAGSPASGGAQEESGAGSNLGVPVDRAVARLFVVGFPGTTPNAPFFARLKVREWGGVLLARSNYVEPGQLKTLAERVTQVAKASGHQAPLVAARQAGGEDSAFGNLPPDAQFDQLTPVAARAQARRSGEQLRALGLNMTLAPDANLGSVGGPWDGRGFSAEAGDVVGKTVAAVTGYRGAKVVAAVGHFPGEGGASGDPTRGPATVGLGLDELRAADLLPFVKAGPDAEVVAMSGALYAAFDGVTPATLLPEAVALLRKEARFDGVVLSADLGAAAFASGTTPGDAAIDALNAGCDLLLLPGDAADQEQAVRTVVRAVRRGTVSAARVKDALRRVTALKKRYGIR